MFSILFAVKLANFSMFTVSEENTGKCLKGSSDIFAMVGPLCQSSEIFDSLRESSLAFFRNNLQSGRKFLYFLNKIILAFLEPFCFFLEKIYSLKEFFTVSVKMPKI